MAQLPAYQLKYVSSGGELQAPRCCLARLQMKAAIGRGLSYRDADLGAFTTGAGAHLRPFKHCNVLAVLSNAREAVLAEQLEAAEAETRVEQ